MIAIQDRGLDKECIYNAVRSSGPGGQHVNKVATKIELSFDIMASTLLNDEEKSMLMLQLRNKISDAGLLKISSAASRSQATNKALATEKLIEMISKGLIKPKARKKTKVPRAVKEKILTEKKIAGERKVSRKVSRKEIEERQ